MNVVSFFLAYMSYLNGLQALCEWRDIIARAEDESTGYVLPNKTLLEIGRNFSSFHQPPICILVLLVLIVISYG